MKTEENSKRERGGTRRERKRGGEEGGYDSNAETVAMLCPITLIISAAFHSLMTQRLEA